MEARMTLCNMSIEAGARAALIAPDEKTVLYLKDKPLAPKGDLLKEAMEETLGQVSHDMERYLTSLGIIASVSPLLGLLGTVVGMINVFTALMLEGAGNANVLAGGISQALITTAAGLSVAIPALIFHRFFLRRIDELVITMEQEASKLVEIMQSDSDEEPRL